MHNNNSINKINNTKRFYSKNKSENKKLSCPSSAIKGTYKQYKNKAKTIKINSILPLNNSDFDKYIDKHKNLSLKIIDVSNKNNNSIKNNEVIKKYKNNISKESINKFKKIKIEDYTTKKINDIQNEKIKLKRINLNQLLKMGKIKRKYKMEITKGKKRMFNLKITFRDHFSTEGNRISDNDNSLLINKKHLSYNNTKATYREMKSKRNIINNENIINSNNLLKKVGHTKDTKLIENNINEKQIIQSNKLIKKNNYFIKKFNIINSSNQNFYKKDKAINLNINDYSFSLETSTKEEKNNNKYMKQSKILSEYIKDYYKKNKCYPQTKLEFYKIGKVLGQGGFGKVNLGLNILTGRVVAIKSFDKNIRTKYGDKINMDKILYEINLMRKLNHQNITKILETFEDKQFYFIIMEYINGGNLFSYVKKRRKLSEKVAKFIFRQIMLGIKHIHSKLIVYRDIKLENILIDMNNKIQICDFGIGIILSSENEILHHYCGTPMYIAPEIILNYKKEGYKGFPVDIWSAGIALYIMVSGNLPFNLDEYTQDLCINNQENSAKNQKLKDEILHKEPKYIENISNELRDLLKGLLNKDPNKRFNCEQILNHPWLNDINYNNINLFSKSEKNLLTQAFIDYRKRKNEEIIENFTFSNLFKDKENNDDKYNRESKSSLLTPFNSINYEYFNIINSDKDRKEKHVFDDFYNNKLVIEKDMFSFSNKTKELNYQYELDNNKEVDNGVLINSKSNEESNSSSYSNPNINRNVFIDKKINLDVENYEMLTNKTEKKSKEILSQIENFGYDKEYVIKSLKDNFLNHATAVYFLLVHYNDI